MRRLEIITPENVAVSYAIAGPGSRFVALLLDTLLRLLGTAVITATAVALFSISAATFDALSPWLVGVLVIALWLLWQGYMIVFELVWNGQTPGKRAMGLRVLSDGGLPVDFRAVLLRNVLRVVDTMPVPGSYVVGGAFAMLNAHGKRLGDMVGGTVVVVEPRTGEASQGAGAGQTVPPTAAASQLPLDWALLDLSRLQPNDWQIINAYLERWRELDGPTAGRMASRIAAPLLQRLEIRGWQIGNQFHAFLVGLAAEYRRRLDEPI